MHDKYPAQMNDLIQGLIVEGLAPEVRGFRDQGIGKSGTYIIKQTYLTIKVI